MNSVSSLSNPESQIEFRGKYTHKIRYFIPKLCDRIFNPRRLTLADRINDVSRGMRLAEELNERGSVEEAREVIKNASFCHSFDFLNGLNAKLNKDLAEKAYKAL